MGIQLAEFNVLVVGIAIACATQRGGERPGRLDGADGAEGGEAGGGWAAEVAFRGLGVEGRGWGWEVEAA